ncbi:hypothetical protein BFW38_10055 [Terasakiispira papahanaumokuakeensis]|uniref:RiboL-PSP-HEPN domain-containing protein n=1 Tax=Terasakiispira papahanaumokuakeensis TaxID=197479 RepID=A0A1E2VB08_9GAMM|nr:hypothetical protein [Terasakiispira papahanaumokuakeensis]ODC03835.1 hypothetical protein BFW38_10055 [Terasakiispira papahanaumokuakeensis]
MPRKKSIKKTASDFIERANELEEFVNSDIAALSDMQKSWCHDYAIIRLYREFEQMMLHVIIGAINNDSSVISETTGVEFPKHLTDEVCEYLVLGGGYFDFKGRDGLIKTLKKYVPEAHYLISAVKKSKYKDALEKLSALRNYAAHESAQSKRAALAAIRQKRVGTSGSWLKLQGRYASISTKLKEVAQEIHDSAPY